jgi:tetratricopeptide (TPR) repeat protein
MDRQETLRRADKLLKQGKIEAAIAEYERAVDEQPRDWTTANLLGELYVRAGQAERAAAHYSRIAAQFRRDGFLPRAAALYKKILKIKPDDEHALLQAAEISVQQGLLADAKTHLNTLAERRVRQGDRRGAADVAARIAKLDPEDIQAQIAAARIIAELGDREAAREQYRKAAAQCVERKHVDGAITLLSEAAGLDPADVRIQQDLVRAFLAAGRLDEAAAAATSTALLKEVATELQNANRLDEALGLLSRALAGDPSDTSVRLQLGRAHIARRDLVQAARVVTAETAGNQPDLLLMLAEIELRARRVPQAGRVMRTLLQRDPRYVDQIVQLGCALAEGLPDAGFACIDAAVSTALQVRDLDGAIIALEKYIDRAPQDVAALMRLADICSEGGFDHNLYEAQVRLADALIRTHRWAEARPWAEAVVVRRPDEPGNVERLRQVLGKLGVQDPDRVIADRLRNPGDVVTPGTAAPPAPPVRIRVTESVSPKVTRPTPGILSPSGVRLPPARPGELVYELKPEETSLGDILGEDASGGAVEREAFLEVDLSRALDELGTPSDIPSSSTAPAEAPRPGSGPADRQPPRETQVDVVTNQKPDDPQNSDLEVVFKEFRDELSRQTQAEEAAEQLKLGLTYRDMGMLDQAKKSLEVAARAPALRFEAASSLARIARDRGADREAIDWFERAAEAPAPTGDAGRAILYELGDLLETRAEHARALAVFLELRAQAPSYRDVSSRVDRLSKER